MSIFDAMSGTLLCSSLLWFRVRLRVSAWMWTKAEGWHQLSVDKWFWKWPWQKYPRLKDTIVSKLFD